MRKLFLSISGVVVTLSFSGEFAEAQSERNTSPKVINVGVALDFVGKVKSIQETGYINSYTTINAEQTFAKTTSQSGSFSQTVQFDRNYRTVTVTTIDEGKKSTSVTKYDSKGCAVSRKNFFPDFTSTAVRTCDDRTRLLQDKNVLKYISTGKVFSDYTEVYTWSEDGREAKVYRLAKQPSDSEEGTRRYNSNGNIVYSSVIRDSKRYYLAETSYSYDSKGNWIQRVTKFTTYTAGVADKPSVDVTTRKITYY